MTDNDTTTPYPVDLFCMVPALQFSCRKIKNTYISHLNFRQMFMHYEKILQQLQATELTSMTAEYLLIYNSCNWQTVEAVRECLPQLYVVPPFA
jgi:hypothetical protein